MLSLDIRPNNHTVKSGRTVKVVLEVRSTRDDAVQVVLHFPSPNAHLTPHTASIPVAKTPGSKLRKGQTTLEVTVTGKKGWYTLTGHATDGDSQTHDETLLSVTA